MLRVPLGQINGNRKRGPDLSPYTRGLIIARHQLDLKPRKISYQLQIARSTIYSTIQQEALRDNGNSLSRPGRPRAVSERDKRHILMRIKADPFITYRELRDATDLNISASTFLRILKESGYGHWRARKRPRLTAEHARLRYAWAKAHKNWFWDEWAFIIWSDECSVELGKGKQNIWCFHLNRLGEKWKKEFIQPYKKGKGIAIMIWASIWGDGHSEITIMDCDPESKRQGYFANSYIKVLEDNLYSIWEPGLQFMQDNASIHSTKKVKA